MAEERAGVRQVSKKVSHIKTTIHLKLVSWGIKSGGNDTGKLSRKKLHYELDKTDSQIKRELWGRCEDR